MGYSAGDETGTGIQVSLFNAHLRPLLLPRSQIGDYCGLESSCQSLSLMSVICRINPTIDSSKRIFSSENSVKTTCSSGWKILHIKRRSKLWCSSQAWYSFRHRPWVGWVLSILHFPIAPVRSTLCDEFQQILPGSLQEDEQTRQDLK